jgi:thiosulfate dehydrogenase [quinone] large subunit
MTYSQKLFIVLLRISMGWLFFYAGIIKVVNPNWSAAGYLKGAKTFTGFYQWLASPDILPFTNFFNEWGLTLVGVALILGVSVRFASVIGAGMMILYYFPILTFPKIGTTSYIIDEHIIYALVFLLLGALNAGRIYGLGNWLANSPSAILRRLA